jgi:hypothetical protein
MLADAVEKLFRHGVEATLIQRKSRTRNIDSRDYLCGFNCCSNGLLEEFFHGIGDSLPFPTNTWNGTNAPMNRRSPVSAKTPPCARIAFGR